MSQISGDSVETGVSSDSTSGSGSMTSSGFIDNRTPLWSPSAERIAQAELTAFSAFVTERFPETHVSTYEALHQWSITATHDF